VNPRPEIVPLPGNVEQHEGERLLRTGQRPEGYPSDGAALFLGDEAPVGAHCAGGLEEEVELVCTDGTGAHLCGPAAVAG
jgi:hypothetical protein